MRYRLRSADLLRQHMRNVAGRDRSHTVRSLAGEVGCSPSVIGHLLAGRRDTVSGDVAQGVAESLQVPRWALFTPKAFTFRNSNRRGRVDPKESERSMRSRISAHKSWAKTSDRAARTAAARKAAGWTRFENQVKAEAAAAGEELTSEVLRQRTESKRSAFYAEMTLRSAQARRAQMEQKYRNAPRRGEAA